MEIVELKNSETKIKILDNIKILLKGKDETITFVDDYGSMNPEAKKEDGWGINNRRKTF